MRFRSLLPGPLLVLLFGLTGCDTLHSGSELTSVATMNAVGNTPNCVYPACVNREALIELAKGAPLRVDGKARSHADERDALLIPSTETLQNALAREICGVRFCLQETLLRGMRKRLGFPEIVAYRADGRIVVAFGATVRTDPLPGCLRKLQDVSECRTSRDQVWQYLGFPTCFPIVTTVVVVSASGPQFVGIDHFALSNVEVSRDLTELTTRKPEAAVDLERSNVRVLQYTHRVCGPRQIGHLVNSD